MFGQPVGRAVQETAVTVAVLNVAPAQVADVVIVLCSCRVRGVDGSCAKHLTVESYMVIYAPNSYTY